MTQPAADSLAETEIWWGGYSWRALIPEIAFTLVLTALLVALLWLLLPRSSLHVVEMPAAFLLWAVQGIRWGWLYIGFNYRLTNRALYIQRGFDNTKAERLELSRIDKVLVRQSWLSKRLLFGRIVLVDREGKVRVLEGLEQPEVTARLIHETTLAAKR